MKKIFNLFFVFTFITSLICADEAKLFDCTAKADVLNTGYDWIANAKAIGVSGMYEPGKNLYNPILSEKYGLAVRTDSAPNADSTYAIEFITPNFNEPNSGAGYIQNAAAIREMELILTLNRGYDEVTIVWEQNGCEHFKKIKASDATSTVESMVEFTAHVNFDDYVSDVKNRPNKQIPVAGFNMTNIYLKRIVVTTHRAPGNWMYSPTSIIGIKSISVIYDKAVTSEAYERGKEADDVFGVQSTKLLEEKTKRKIESDLRMNEYNKSLMATEESK